MLADGSLPLCEGCCEVAFLELPSTSRRVGPRYQGSGSGWPRKSSRGQTSTIEASFTCGI